MTEFLLVTTTTDSQEKANTIAEALVQQKLAACVQVNGPVTSIYRWQGKVEHAEEWVCAAKSQAAAFDQVAAAICELHSYDCPEIIATAIVDGSADYLKWLGKNC